MESRILIVDDEPDMEFLIKQKFRSKIKSGEFKFSFANNGREALKQLENENFDLVLTDINMPEMDGLTLLDHIKNLNLILKTIVVSAYGDFANIRTAMNRGAFDFITKPIDFTDLETTIDKTLIELQNLKDGLLAQENLTVTLKEKDIAILEREKSEQSRKIKEQFLANMSHEIRTPLNAVIGMTNLVLNTPLDEKQKNYLTSIKKASQNLLVIINDILDFSKIEAGKMELEKVNFNLQEVLNTIYETLHLKAEEKNIIFKINAENQMPEILIGDPVRIAQILINLTSNAIKFTSEGKVEINYESKIRGNILNIIFKIRDTGIGMTAEEQLKVFESFSQANSSTTRKYGGTGLGLTITRQLVELHNGSIGVSSIKGKGTEFTVKLPLEIGNENVDIPNQSSHERVDGVESLKVLLVEDNEFNQIVATDTLQQIFPSATVDLAENGLIALEKIENQNYDIVLMDIQMPEMDGYTATQILRNNPATASLPVIAMTANALKEEVEKCFIYGMNDYISKPFDPEKLFDTIINVLKKSKVTI